jgi:tRNA pseudouridine55 synthase
LSSLFPGCVLINKPSGITSFQALYPIKKALSTRKVGHTGTLDRFAEGLMVVLVGQASKLNRYFTELDKTYEAVIRFGVETDTLDPEGTIVETAGFPDPGLISLRMQSFLGAQTQTPPAYSAVHIDGERAYRRVLSGEDPAMPERSVEFYRMELIEYTEPDLRCVVQCSKGTYIRSFARDLGISLESRAHLVELKRVKIGDLSVTDAVRPEELDVDRDIKTGSGLVNCVPSAGSVSITRKQALDVKNGVPMSYDSLEKMNDGPLSHLVFLLEDNDTVVAAIDVDQNTRSISYIFVVGT